MIPKEIGAFINENKPASRHRPTRAKKTFEGLPMVLFLNMDGNASQKLLM
jgi:hypothetical protein